MIIKISLFVFPFIDIIDFTFGEEEIGEFRSECHSVAARNVVFTLILKIKQYMASVWKTLKRIQRTFGYLLTSIAFYTSPRIGVFRASLSKCLL